jgi:anti-sigma factor RsiW
MNDARLRELYADLIARNDPSDRNACVSPEQMSALVERTLPEAERLALLDHVTSCKACHKEFELLRALHVAAAQARPARPAQPTRRWMVLAASVALIATAALVWLAVWPGSPDVIRGGGGSPVVILVSPAEDVSVSLPAQLVWRSVAPEARYVVELLDSDGAVAFTETTADTVLLLSETTSPLSAGTYTWLVVAETRDAGQVRATPRRLRIQPK